MNRAFSAQDQTGDPQVFYGRTDLLNEIANFLRNKQSISLVGPHDIGKTALLLHLLRADTRAPLGIGAGAIFVYVDCRSLSRSTKEEVLTFLCARVADVLQTQHIETEACLQAVNSISSWMSFEVGLRRLNRDGLRVVFLLDAFEQLSLNPQIDLSFYNALRSAASRFQLAFLTASVDPLIELTYLSREEEIVTSPFFNIFAQINIGLMSEEEARLYIQKFFESAGLIPGSHLPGELYTLVGGHPRAIQTACSCALASPDNLPEIKRRTLHELEGFFMVQWSMLSPLEQDILRSLDKVEALRRANPAVEVSLRDLSRKCLLIHAEDTYKLPSEAWVTFIASQPLTR